jgi:hypothetical protein
MEVNQNPEREESEFSLAPFYRKVRNGKKYESRPSLQLSDLNRLHPLRKPPRTLR